MNLADLHKAAQQEGVDVESKPSSKTELTAGERYTVAVELARDKGKNDKGTQTYSAMFRILSGPDNVNRTYWDNFYISPKETAASFNARSFHYLAVLGLDLDVLVAAEGLDAKTSEATLTAATKGRVIQVDADYDGDFPRNHYEVEGPELVEVPVDDDEEEDDEEHPFS